MSLTLAEFHALDFGALWASLSTEAQARIGVLAIEREFADQVSEDGGFDTTEADRAEAGAIATEALNALPDVVWSAFPELLPIEHDDLYPLWVALGEARRPRGAGTVRVHGLRGTRCPRQVGGRWFVRDGGGLVELHGARDLASRIEGADPVWQFWTVADVEAERARRHPEFAGAETVP